MITIQFQHFVNLRVLQTAEESAMASSSAMVACFTLPLNHRCDDVLAAGAKTRISSPLFLYTISSFVGELTIVLLNYDLARYAGVLPQTETEKEMKFPKYICDVW